MSGLSRLQNMFRVADLRNKILFTIFISFVFRMGSHIPVPYVDFKAIQELSKQAGLAGGGAGPFTLVPGGWPPAVPIFLPGIMPDIPASIIMQLLGVVIPKL